MEKNNPEKPQTSLLNKFFLISLGLFYCLCLIEIGLRLGGFAFLSLQQYKNYLSLKQKGVYRILCLGESTTANGYYPAFLEEELNKRNVGISFSVINRGVPGTLSSNILENLESNLDAFHPDMVITMMGINELGASRYASENAFDSRGMQFLKSFRTYKLARLLWLRMVPKPQEPVCSGRAQGLSEAEKPMLLVPNVGQPYEDRGRILGFQGKLSEAEASFKKAIELCPNDGNAYILLAWIYRSQGRFPEAIAASRKALELNPNNDWAYMDLGQTHYAMDNLSEAAASYEKAVALHTQDDSIYSELGKVYQCQGKLPEAVASFKKAIELNPSNSRSYRALKTIYRDMGDSRLSSEWDKKAKKVFHYLPVTIDNYKKLKAILDKRGITYVCVQYPMLDIRPLKQIFQGHEEGIVFVDNEKTFKDALQHALYKDYFSDAFAGDFGHCTKKGHRLLASNVARVISKEVFLH